MNATLPKRTELLFNGANLDKIVKIGHAFVHHIHLLFIKINFIFLEGKMMTIIN